MIANLTPKQQLVATVPVPCTGGGGGSYTLPTATPTTLGGVKVGTNVQVATDGTISVPNDSCVQRVIVEQAGLAAGTRSTLNFIPGSKMAISAVDNPATNAVDITFTGTGGAAGAATNLAVNGTTVGQQTTLNLIAGPGLSIAGNLNNPNQSVEATIAALVTSVFGRTGAIAPVAGDYTAAQVTNAVDKTQTYPDPAWITSLAWSKIAGAPADAVPSVFGRTGPVVAQAGDYTAAQVTNAVSTAGTYADPAWLTALNWSKLTGSPSSAQIAVIQTPWLQDIAGTTFRLLNAGNIGVGSSLATSFISAPNAYVQVGSDSNSAAGRAVLCSVQNTAGPVTGEIDFVNFQNAGTDKRIVYIAGLAGGTVGTSGSISIGTANAGAPTEKFKITGAGVVSMGFQAAGNDFFNLSSNSLNAGLLLWTNVASGGQIALRSNSSVNMLQSGNQGNTAGQDFRITSNNAGTTWMSFQGSSGNIGIGATATSPNAKLEIVDAINQTNGNLRIDVPVASAGDYSAIAWSTGTTAGNVTAAIKSRLVAAGHMAFDFLAQSSGQTTLATLPTVMSILGNGNVGIGSSNPGARLETFGAGGAPATSGTSQASASLRISRAGGSNVMDCGSYTTSPFGLWLQGTDYSNLATNYAIILQPNGGNVGIGTTSPQGALHVAGGNSLLTALASQAIVDGNMSNSNIQFYLDEAGNNLKVRVKYSSGTLKTATVALA